MNDNPDKNIVAGLKNGDHHAFEYFFKKYSKRVYGFAFKMLNNKHESENMVQVIFMKLWENREFLDENLSLKSYLFQITRNTVTNLLKRKIHHQVYLDYMKGSESCNNMDDEIEYQELNKEIENSIEGLPERRKAMFLMSRYENMSYKEIAAKLNVSVNTVDTQIRHALKYLKEELKKKFNKIP
jgi:RNA polymerase sigma-70 factor (ECF subfamily)